MGAAASGSSVLSTHAGSGDRAGFLPFLLGPVSVQSEPCLSAGLLGQQPTGLPCRDRQRAASVNLLRHLATLLGSATQLLEPP